jgi:ATP-binding cassette subfamily B protein
VSALMRDRLRGRGGTMAARLALYRRLGAYARPYWWHLAGILLLQLLSTPLALLAPLPLKIAVDTVIGSKPLPSWLNALLPAHIVASPTALLTVAAGILLATALLGSLQDLATELLQTYTGEKLSQDFRSRLFCHVQRLSLSYHDTRGTSDSTYRIQYDAPSIQRVLVDGLIPLCGAAVTLVAMIYVTVRIDWRLAIVALSVSPVLFVLVRTFGPRLRRSWKEIKKLDSSAMSVVQEVLSSVRVVKAFGREDREHARFLEQSSNRVRREVDVAALQGAFDVFVGVAMAAGSAAARLIGVRQVRAGSLSLGNLLLVMAYLQQIYKPLKTLSKKTADLQSALAGADRAFALLDESPEVSERRNAVRIARARGDLLFLDVSFAYDPDRPVLYRISFAAPSGTKVGIRGMTGAGKTTLMGLLMRFYDPTGGFGLPQHDNDPFVRLRTYVDETELNHYPYAMVRNGILFLALPEMDYEPWTRAPLYEWVEFMTTYYHRATTIIFSHQAIEDTTPHDGDPMSSYRGQQDQEWWARLFRDNPQIKMWIHAHNHMPGWYVGSRSSGQSRPVQDFGHEMAFSAPHPQMVWAGNLDKLDAVDIYTISATGVTARAWGNDGSAGHWVSGFDTTWRVPTTYDPNAEDWYSFPALIQDGETQRTDMKVLSSRVTLQLVGTEPVELFYDPDMRTKGSHVNENILGFDDDPTDKVTANTPGMTVHGAWKVTFPPKHEWDKYAHDGHGGQPYQ